MSENGNKTFEILNPEPSTPATTKKESGKSRKGNTKRNFRRGNEGGVNWLEQTGL